jgi:hypothetical protein
MNWGMESFLEARAGYCSLRFFNIGPAEDALEAECGERASLLSLPAAFSRTENIEQVRQALVHIFKTEPVHGKETLAAYAHRTSRISEESDLGPGPK